MGCSLMGFFFYENLAFTYHVSLHVFLLLLFTSFQMLMQNKPWKNFVLLTVDCGLCTRMVPLLFLGISLMPPWNWFFQSKTLDRINTNVVDAYKVTPLATDILITFLCLKYTLLKYWSEIYVESTRLNTIINWRLRSTSISLTSSTCGREYWPSLTENPPALSLITFMTVLIKGIRGSSLTHNLHLASNLSVSLLPKFALLWPGWMHEKPLVLMIYLNVCRKLVLSSWLMSLQTFSSSSWPRQLCPSASWLPLLC